MTNGEQPAPPPAQPTPSIPWWMSLQTYVVATLGAGAIHLIFNATAGFGVRGTLTAIAASVFGTAFFTGLVLGFGVIVVGMQTRGFYGDPLAFLNLMAVTTALAGVAWTVMNFILRVSGSFRGTIITLSGNLLWILFATLMLVALGAVAGVRHGSSPSMLSVSSALNWLTPGVSLVAVVGVAAMAIQVIFGFGGNGRVAGLAFLGIATETFVATLFVFLWILRAAAAGLGTPSTATSPIEPIVSMFGGPARFVQISAFAVLGFGGVFALMKLTGGGGGFFVFTAFVDSLWVTLVPAAFLWVASMFVGRFGGYGLLAWHGAGDAGPVRPNLDQMLGYLAYFVLILGLFHGVLWTWLFRGSWASAWTTLIATVLKPMIVAGMMFALRGLHQVRIPTMGQAQPEVPPEA